MAFEFTGNNLQEVWSQISFLSEVWLFCCTLDQPANSLEQILCLLVSCAYFITKYLWAFSVCVSDLYWKMGKKHFINSWGTAVVSDTTVKEDTWICEAEKNLTHPWHHFGNPYFAQWHNIVYELKHLGQEKILFFSIFSNFYNFDECIIGFWYWKIYLRLENPLYNFEIGKACVSYLCFVPRIIFRLKCSILLFFTCIYFNVHIYMILQQVGLFIRMEKDVRSVSCSRS